MHVPLLVTDFLRRAERQFGPKLAVVDGQHRFTYREFAARCYRMAHALDRLGVQKGDRVGMLSPNTHHFLEAFFATASLGAVLVPLNYRLTAEDFEYCLTHAGARVVLADLELCPAVRVHVEHRVVARHRQEPVPEGWLDWEELIRDCPDTPPPDPGLSEDDLVSLNYTSGTTARPKGVMLTHRNFYVNAYNYLAHFGASARDVYLWTLPMFHCNGWGGVYALTGVGATQVIVRVPAPELILPAVAAEGVTMACMAPVVLHRLLDFPERGRFELRTRPRIICAGAPPPASHIRRLEEELGWEFLQLYGLTETSPILTVSELRPHVSGERHTLQARAGQAALGVELAVLDSQGRPVPADDHSVGEVAARGNMIFAGYWRQPEETARVVREGWFFTGDLATWDESGSINLVDRAKDVIISGGENISSIEVEEALYRHPAVAEAAVVGLPHEEWGETPLAVVVLRPGQSAAAEELRDFLREHLAHFKVPTRYEFVAALPRTATGKLKKYELREPYWKGEGRRVH